MAKVYEFNVPTFGKGVVFDVDHKVRGEQFRFFAEALKSARLKLYVPLFVQEAQVKTPYSWKHGTVQNGSLFMRQAMTSCVTLSIVSIPRPKPMPFCNCDRTPCPAYTACNKSHQST